MPRHYVKRSKKGAAPRIWQSGDWLVVTDVIPMSGGLKFKGLCVVTGVHEGGRTLRVRGKTGEESDAHWTVYVSQCRYRPEGR